MLKQPRPEAPRLRKARKTTLFSMKQKITISLPVNSDGCRAKAMQIAVATAGVISVNIDAAKNQLAVIGDGIDFFVLMKCLKRKFRCASIVAIEEVKPPEKKDEKKDEKKKGECCPCPPGYNNPCVQYYPVGQPVYDPYPQNCSIL